MPPAPPPLPPAPDSPLDAEAAPRLGAYRGSLGAVDLARAAGTGIAGRVRRAARAKRWVYALVVADEVLAAAAIVETGYAGAAFAWAVDRRSGAVLADRAATGVPGIAARVGDRPGEGARASFAAPGLSIRLERRADRYRLEVEAGDALVVDAVLETRGAPEPLVLVAPVPDAGFRATQKAGALPVAGSMRARGATFSLDGGLGGIDYTAGLLARETEWRWAFATGAVGGVPVALNLAEGFHLGADDPGENAVFSGAGPARLPPVSFERDPALRATPWRIASADGAVDLAFAPLAVHREVRELKILRTRFAQIAGTFRGRFPGPDGRPLEVDALPGVVEDHWARW